MTKGGNVSQAAGHMKTRCSTYNASSDNTKELNTCVHACTHKQTYTYILERRQFS